MAGGDPHSNSPPKGERTSPFPIADYFDRVLDAAERARGDEQTRLLALSNRLEGAAERFEQARQALAGASTPAYLAALNVLAACCPPEAA